MSNEQLASSLDNNIHPCFLTPKLVQPEYPLFVFLPGMDGTGELLRAQTTGLETAFDVRCLAIPRDDATSWEMLTEKVLELIRAELQNNPQRSVYLCGESFGACLALKVAIAQPQLFSRMILINSASSFHRRPWYEWTSQLAQLIPSCLYQVGALGLLPFLASLGRILPGDRQELLKTMRSVPPQTVLWRLSLVREFDAGDVQLSSITQPVLVIASALDRLLPSLTEAKRLVNVFPHAQLAVLPHSGHACLIESDINLYEIMNAHHFLDKSAERVSSSVGSK